MVEKPKEGALMRRLMTLMVLTVLSGGCMLVPGPTGGGYIFHQVGIAVRVVNNCAPFLDLETVVGVVVRGLPYGDSVTVPLVTAPFGGSNRRLELTAKGYGPNREYFGSTTAHFYVSTYEGSRGEFWNVDRLGLPGGRGGCQ